MEPSETRPERIADPSPARSDSLRGIEARFPRLTRIIGPALEIVDSVGVDQVGVEAGSMTYGAFLSIPPLLLLAVTAAAQFFSDRPNAAQDLIARAESILPGLGELVGSGLRLRPQTVVSAGIFGVAGLVWSASGFAVRARHALGAVFGTELLGLVSGRLVAAVRGVPTLLLFALYAAAASWVTTLGGPGLVGLAAGALAFVVLLGGGVLMWTTVYAWTTPGTTGPSFRDHLTGGIAFTIAFLGLQRFGAFYVDLVVARSRALYGAIGALFGLFAFLYLVMWVFLLGAELTKRRVRGSTRHPNGTRRRPP